MYTPGADTPSGQTPLRRYPPSDIHTPGQTPPQADLPEDGHCSGWYASYWNAFLFLKFYMSAQVLFVEPLISLFWISGDICPGFQSQYGFLACLPRRQHTRKSRFTSDATPADLLPGSMAARPFRSIYLHTYNHRLPHSVWQDRTLYRLS